MACHVFRDAEGAFSVDVLGRVKNTTNWKTTLVTVQQPRKALLRILKKKKRPFLT